MQITPGAGMCVGSMPKHHVRSLAGEIDGDPVLERLHHQNICQVKHAHFARMAQTFFRGAKTTCHLKPALYADDAARPFLKELISQIIRTPLRLKNIGLVATSWRSRMKLLRHCAHHV